MLLHLFHDLLYDLFLCADLVTGNEPAKVVHVHQRTDLEQTAEHAGCFRNAAAFHKEGEVRGEKPVVYLQPVFSDPVRKFLCIQTFIPLRGRGVHQQAVTRGSAQRVNHVYFTLGITFFQYQRRVAGGIDGSGNAGREADVYDILSLFKKRCKEIDIFGNVYL